MEEIPKIIHQIWIGPNKKPNMWMKTFYEDYINMYNDWTYKLWNEDNIEELFTDFLWIKKIYYLEPTYNGKSDILRYLILYHYGGIYIDADSVWLNNKNFEDLIEEVNETNMFVGYVPPEDIKSLNFIKKNLRINGSVMGSSKKNKYIKLIIDGLKMRPIDFRRKRKILGASTVVGPGHIQKMIDQFNEKISIFPSNYFCPITFFGVNNINLHKEISIPKESYTFQFGYSTNNLKDLIE